MKQIYKADGPYKTEDGKSYDVRNINSTEKAPKGWNSDLSKVLSGAKKAVQTQAINQQEIQQEL